MIKSIVKSIINKLGYSILKNDPIERVASSLYKKYHEYTMIPHQLYIDNIKLISNFSHIDGCIVECGVWRGGMSAGMAEIFPDRKILLFDSFEGLPEAKEIDGVSALKWQKNTSGTSYYNNCRAEMEVAETAMKMSGTEFELIKGWFNETIPNYKLTEKIAILRLDADWYDSTMECLENLYPKVEKNGIVIFDDYYTWDGCSRALHDYLSKIKSVSRIHKTNSGLPYIIKRD